MALRLVEVTVPVGDLERIPVLLQDVPSLHMRTSNLDDDTGLVSILLEAGNVETVTDRLASQFGSSPVFRLMVLPVEATLPLPPQPSEEKAAEGEESEENKAQAERISREELYEDVSQAGRLTTTYLVMVALSTVVAAVGLIRGDVAIIVGAMVIAPLLGPNVALSLAVTLGDRGLAQSSLRALGAGVAVSMVLSVLTGILLHINPAAPELVARTHPDIGDIVLALAAGAAGSLAFTSGVPTVVVGVMISVALLPPLVVAGLLVGAGYWTLAGGAFVLLLTNVTCINLAAVATFFLQKITPRTWWEADRARRTMRLVVTVWILMLGLLVALVVFGHVGAV